jgi:hypothetical protein
MSHDDRRKSPACASVVSMHVTSADAACLNPDQQFIIGRLWLGYIDDVELLIARKYERFHPISF